MKKFAIVALDLKHKIFIVYIVVLNIDSSDEMHSLKRAEIAYMKANEASTKVSGKHVDIIEFFFPKLVVELHEHPKINNYIIKFLYDWQPPHNPIYNLGSVKLETLKTYIENNLANIFIRHSKSLVRITIFFDKKPDKSLQLCIITRILRI